MRKTKKDVLARLVCYTRQQTTVFVGAPIVSGSAAVLLGNVTNNGEGAIELAVGGVNGKLAVFKAEHSSPEPYFEATGLGTLSALGLGRLFLGYGNDQQQLIACTEEGVCHIFNIRPSDVKWDQESSTGRVAPVWSVTCPKNVTSCCIADIDGDKMQEVVVGTREGGVHVLKMNFNREEEEGEEEEGQEESCGDVYSSSSAAQSRASTPAMPVPVPMPVQMAVGGDHGPESVADLQALGLDGSYANRRHARRPSDYSIDPSELHFLENQQGAATPDKANSTALAPPDHDPNSVPLSPHLKTLLELKAKDAVTSLSIVYVPETDDTLSAPSRADSAGSAAAAMAATQLGERYNVRVDGGSPDAGVSKPKPDPSEHPEAPSAAGVYVSAGLETGAVEVMRLSSRRPGTRVFNLVKASARSDRLSSGRSDRMSSSCDAAVGPHPADDGPVGDDEASGEGLFGRAGGGDDANERLRGEELASPAGAMAGYSAAWTGGATGDRQQARLRLERGDSGLPEQDINLRGAGAAAAAAVLCGWHVPPECESFGSWKGRGLVVGFSDTGLGAGTAPFAATPKTPLDRAFGSTAPPRWGWGGKASESVGGRSGGRTGGGGGGGDEQQTFAVCTMDGCVRCCRVVSSAEGQPQWKKLWTRQTKEALHSFQRLDVPSGRRSDSRGRTEGETESLFVVCSWSGNTFIFDSEGTPCVTFDAKPHLEEHLTAFVAGNLTTSTGTTGPSLVYLDTGGKVVAYHGLLEQVESMAPTPQFVPNLHKDGSIDTLRDLLQSLANRLQWRSNQGDPLFPPEAPPPEATTAATSGSDDAVAAAAAANVFSDDDEQEATLSLPDVILARAVLCPAGVVVALARSARRNDRRKFSADGGGGESGSGGGGGGGGGGGIDDDRWRREVRALAEGNGGTVTVGEGAAAVDRVLREIKAWEARGREPTLKNFPCLRGTLEALTSWGSGPRRESLRRVLKESEAKAEAWPSPGP